MFRDYDFELKNFIKELKCDAGSIKMKLHAMPFQCNISIGQRIITFYTLRTLTKCMYLN